jgi:hypothetical protein
VFIRIKLLIGQHFSKYINLERIHDLNHSTKAIDRESVFYQISPVNTTSTYTYNNKNKQVSTTDASNRGFVKSLRI